MKNKNNFGSPVYLLYFISLLSWLMVFVMFWYVYIIGGIESDKKFISALFIVFEIIIFVGLVLLIRLYFYTNKNCMIKKINNMIGLLDIDLNGMAKQNNDGQYLCYFDDVVDRIGCVIKEHMNNDRSLRESDEYNKVLFEGSRLALLVLDPKTKKLRTVIQLRWRYMALTIKNRF